MKQQIVVHRVSFGYHLPILIMPPAAVANNDTFQPLLIHVLDQVVSLFDFAGPDSRRMAMTTTEWAIKVTITVMVALFVSFLWSFVNKRLRLRYPLPPKAPISFWDTMKCIVTDDIVWFFPRLYRQMATDSGSSSSNSKNNIDDDGVVCCRLNFYVPGATCVGCVFDVDLVRQILSDSTTIKASALVEPFNRCTAGTTQFFTSNGWRYFHARKAMAPAFANAQIRRMDQVTIEKTDQWISKRLERLVDRNEEIDMLAEMSDLTLDIILEAAFEYRMTAEERVELMECVSIVLREFVFSNPLKILFGRFVPSVRRADQKAQRLMGIAKRIMQHYRQMDHPTPKTVLDLIMNNSNYSNDDERAADVVDLIIAGHETSANSMTFLLLELAKSPKEQKRLQQTLLALPEEERKHAKHLGSCIRESMRLWPVTAPGPMRELGRDFVVPNNYAKYHGGDHKLDKKDTAVVIPKGSCVFMPIICLFRNSKIFQDQDIFLPSRWENPTEEMKKAWMPFAIGPRNW